MQKLRLLFVNLFPDDIISKPLSVSFNWFSSYNLFPIKNSDIFPMTLLVAISYARPSTITKLLSNEGKYMSLEKMCWKTSVDSETSSNNLVVYGRI